MSFYRRNLPHWQPIGGDYFITLRLAGTLPKEIIEKLNKEKVRLLQDGNGDKKDLRTKINRRIFKKYETILDKAERGPTWLKSVEIADIIKESLHFRDNKDYELYAYCIMSNHVHFVFRHLSNKLKQKNDEYPITDILASFKKYTSRLCNEKLDRTGNSFWQAESFDHVVRDSDELERVILYTLHNPVKAGLTDNWRKWPHSYCKKELSIRF
ncbi:MAG: transposase [Gracilimonas sp.]|uniref:transposase n=1 Tax=Gracilimonas sp. TaxID=1974203 RepID=UPI00198E931C|nr:transposase [Gracilimonas sp.]MBD3617136.1 transposase [Gracilimonas sp.]